MQFSIAGGTMQTAGCDWALMGASVTNFGGQIGNNPIQAPAAFSANVTSTPYPCDSGSKYGELVGGPLVLESQGDLFTDHVRLFDGSIGSWYIETAQLVILPSAADPPAASVCEPGSLALLALGVAAVAARRARPAAPRDFQN
jgi:hypothetical protein